MLDDVGKITRTNTKRSREGSEDELTEQNRTYQNMRKEQGMITVTSGGMTCVDLVKKLKQVGVTCTYFIMKI